MLEEINIIYVLSLKKPWLFDKKMIIHINVMYLYWLMYAFNWINILKKNDICCDELQTRQICSSCLTRLFTTRSIVRVPNAITLSTIFDKSGLVRYKAKNRVNVTEFHFHQIELHAQKIVPQFCLRTQKVVQMRERERAHQSAPHLSHTATRMRMRALHMCAVHIVMWPSHTITEPSRAAKTKINARARAHTSKNMFGMRVFFVLCCVVLCCGAHARSRWGASRDVRCSNKYTKKNGQTGTERWRKRRVVRICALAERNRRNARGAHQPNDRLSARRARGASLYEDQSMRVGVCGECVIQWNLCAPQSTHSDIRTLSDFGKSLFKK